MLNLKRYYGNNNFDLWKYKNTNNMNFKHTNHNINKGEKAYMEVMKKNVVNAGDLPQIWASVTNTNKKPKKQCHRLDTLFLQNTMLEKKGGQKARNHLKRTMWKSKCQKWSWRLIAKMKNNKRCWRMITEKHKTHNQPR